MVKLKDSARGEVQGRGVEKRLGYEPWGEEWLRGFDADRWNDGVLEEDDSDTRDAC